MLLIRTRKSTHSILDQGRERYTDNGTWSTWGAIVKPLLRVIAEEVNIGKVMVFKRNARFRYGFFFKDVELNHSHKLTCIDGLYVIRYRRHLFYTATRARPKAPALFY